MKGKRHTTENKIRILRAAHPAHLVEKAIGTRAFGQATEGQERGLVVHAEITRCGKIRSIKRGSFSEAP